MNTVTIVLLLSMCFCALCAATPAVSSLDQELVPSEVATKLQRFTRQSSPLNFIEQIASGLISIPTDLVANIVDFILSIIRKIKSTFLSWIENIESLLANLLDNSQNSNQRRRRSNVSNGLSDLISDLPNLLQLPVTYFQQATSSIGDSVGGQIEHIIKTIVKLIWNFVTTRILPWLHEVLNKMQESNVLPSFLNDAIVNANSLYSLLRLFTEISSNAS
ncbi:uncharacterized protein LOC122575492 isoform X2 [Bombus pyrosoma]|uniref:uncharacterized protein LOC122575492 isoform X2 n=1 Tax=Bombus pyrosoma TaxID=396416 RepID=UPI001CB9CE76|nr:uncharacterized protein LOC122575492 isoform X2 [Bombus pyrosoma]